MAVPLVILAFLSTFGWLINAPFGGLDFLQKWLAPVFPPTIAPAFSLSTGTKWTLGIIVTGVCFLGLYIGLRLWVPRYEIRSLEPEFLVHGWYVDEGIADVVSGPLATTAEGFAVADARGVDGLANGVARLAASTGRQLRRVETGYVRNYALGIGIGAVLILAYVATRVGS